MSKLGGDGEGVAATEEQWLIEWVLECKASKLTI